MADLRKWKRIRSTKLITCPRCKKRKPRVVGAINRARKVGAPIYCSARCASMARRKPKLPKRVRKARKAAYDVRYREHNRDEIREKKREYYLRTKSPEKTRAFNRKRRQYHVEYCRKYYSNPKRKAAKVRYDSVRRALIIYRGHREWAECHRLLIRLQSLIRKQQPSGYERRKARGYYDNKRTVIERKRDAQISRW